jgi:hypothetical protein
MAGEATRGTGIALEHVQKRYAWDVSWRCILKISHAEITSSLCGKRHAFDFEVLEAEEF